MDEVIVRTIIDKEDGRKWEIFKKSDNQYYYKYYEFFSQIGWRHTGGCGDDISGYFTKDSIEWEFDIKL